MQHRHCDVRGQTATTTATATTTPLFVYELDRDRRQEVGDAAYDKTDRM